MIIARGTNGPDRINAPGEDGTILARAGDDIVKGGYEKPHNFKGSDFFTLANRVVLGAGDDRTEDFKADDTLFGGQGDDTLTTGYTYDWIGYGAPGCKSFGEEGDDLLIGGGLLNGGVGDDTLAGTGQLIGGRGNDVYRIHAMTHDLVDGDGKSVIRIDTNYSYDDEHHGPSDLRIVTGDRNDVITGGGSYVALIRSGDGGDTIAVYEAGTVYAGNGNDTVSFAVTVFGGNGRDSISASDFAYGGRHADEILGAGGWDGYGEVRGGEGNDTLTSCHNAHGGEGRDVIIGGGEVWGDGGDDTISGATGVRGGAGRDDISECEDVLGGAGDDSITFTANARGQAGDDFVGGTGLLFGDTGNDIVEGSAKNTNDILDGGLGNDVLRFAFAEGDDILRGGADADTYVLTRFVPDTLPELTFDLDTIEGFEHGLDQIDVRIRAASFADLDIEQAGDFVVVKDAGGYNLLAIADDLASNFDASDFVF